MHPDPAAYVYNGRTLSKGIPGRRNNRMKYTLALATAMLLLGSTGSATAAVDPQADLESYKAYFAERFPKFGPEEFSLGMYNFSPDKRAQWEAIKRCPGHYMIYCRFIVNHHPCYSGHN